MKITLVNLAWNLGTILNEVVLSDVRVEPFCYGLNHVSPNSYAEVLSPQGLRVLEIRWWQI